MNNIYTILGLGLLSAAALSSCQQEEIFKGENNGKLPEGTLSTIATISDYAPENGNSRANVQDDGKTFYWNTDDKVTIWDGTKAIEFSATNYNESNPSNNVEFTATGEFADGATVWGIYPSKGTEVTADNIFSFTLSNEIEQNIDGKPHLNKTMFMMAEGKVSGQTITNLTFEHLTALFHVNINNLRTKAVSLKSLTIETYNSNGETATDAVAMFPKKLNIDNGTRNYSENVSKLTVNLQDKSLNNNEKFNGYISFFPTNDLTKDTWLKISLTVSIEGEESTTTIKEGKIGDLYNAESAMANDGYKYVSGKRYGITCSLLPNPEDLGYTVDGNTYTILTVDGFKNLTSQNDVMTNSDVIIKLNDNLDFQNTSLDVIPEINATFDGNNKAISNFSMAITTGNAGLFVSNGGTIKNLTVENVAVTVSGGYIGTDGNTNAGGILVGTNSNNGNIKDCTIKTSSIEATTEQPGSLGAFAGLNLGTVEGCNTEGVVTVKTNGQKYNIGGLIGFNDKGTVLFSSVKEGVKVDNNADVNAASVGGLIGWSRAGTIKGCYANATIKSLNKASSVAGLIGSAWFGQTTPVFTLEASYSAGDIISQGNGASIAGLIGNAEGNNPKTITACYTVTTLPENAKDDNTNYAGFIKKHTATTCNACFYSNIERASSSGTFSGTVPAYVTDISSKMSDMNAALSSSDYEFTNGTGSEPLIIQKKQ